MRSQRALQFALAAVFIALAAAWWWSRWPSASSDGDRSTQLQSATTESHAEATPLEALAENDESERGSAFDETPNPAPPRSENARETLVGLVIARKDRKPIANAQIVVTDESSKRDSATLAIRKTFVHVSELRSDASGKFELSIARLKRPRLEVSAPGFAKAVVIPNLRGTSRGVVTIDGVQLPETVLHGAPVDDQGVTVIELDTGATLRATVVRSSGDYLQGVTVSVRGNLSGQVTEVGSAITDIGGRCTVADIPTGVDVKIGVLRGGAWLKPPFFAWQFAPDETRELEIQVSAGCRIAGQVVRADGKLVPAAEVWLARASVPRPHYFAKRNEDVVDRCAVGGDSFAFEGVVPGKWWIGIVPTADHGDEPRKDALDSRAVYVEVAEGDETKSVELRVHAGLYLRGRVVDPFGNPAKRIPIIARTDGVDGILRVISKDDGKFTIGPVAPDRFTIGTISGNEFARAPPVEATVDAEIVLELGLAGRIQGRVFDLRSRLPVDADVFIAVADVERNLWKSTVSEGAAGYVISGLELGMYHLTASTKDGLVGMHSDVKISHGGGLIELDIGVEPGATLTLLYRGREPRAVVRAIASGIVVAANAVEQGSTMTFVVPARSTLLQHFDGDRILEEIRLELAPGEQRTVELTDHD